MVPLLRSDARPQTLRLALIGVSIATLASLASCHIDLQAVDCVSNDECPAEKHCLSGRCVPKQDIGPQPDQATDTTDDLPPADIPTDGPTDTASDTGDDTSTDAPQEPVVDVILDGNPVDAQVDAIGDPQPTDLGEMHEVTNPCASCFTPRTCVTLSGESCSNTNSICAAPTLKRESVDPPGTGTLEINFILIPQGLFLMGSSSDSDPGSDSDEDPLHQVAMGAFFMSELEITLEQYAACVIHGDCRLSDYQSTSDDPTCVAPILTEEPILPSAQLPMNCVSRDGAARYCAWIGGRLPTEAEWERAARGACGRSGDSESCIIGSAETTRDNVLYPWGDILPACNRACWSDDTCDRAAPCTTGQFTNGRSREGLYDLAGNVAEWVSDAFDSETYSAHGSAATCPDAVVGPSNGILRGESFQDNDERHLRVADRVETSPDEKAPTQGIRCVFDVPSSS